MTLTDRSSSYSFPLLGFFPGKHFPGKARNQCDNKRRDNMGIHDVSGIFGYHFREIITSENDNKINASHHRHHFRLGEHVNFTVLLTIILIHHDHHAVKALSKRTGYCMTKAYARLYQRSINIHHEIGKITVVINCFFWLRFFQVPENMTTITNTSRHR